MKPARSFLLGLALLGLCLSAQAQTTPAPRPKAQPVKALPHTKGAAAPKRTTEAPLYLKDTAAFRRSGRPADGIRIPVRPKN